MVGQEGSIEYYMTLHSQACHTYHVPGFSSIPFFMCMEDII